MAYGFTHSCFQKVLLYFGAKLSQTTGYRVQSLSSMDTANATTTKPITTPTTTITTKSAPGKTTQQQQAHHKVETSFALLKDLKAVIGISKSSIDEIVIATDSYGTHMGWVSVPLRLVPGSTLSSEFGTRYHPSGTMVPLPCHSPLFRS